MRSGVSNRRPNEASTRWIFQLGGWRLTVVRKGAKVRTSASAPGRETPQQAVKCVTEPECGEAVTRCPRDVPVIGATRSSTEHAVKAGPNDTHEALGAGRGRGGPRHAALPWPTFFPDFSPMNHGHHVEQRGPRRPV